MHISKSKNQQSTFENELLSNSTNKQDYLDAKVLFETLKTVRIQKTELSAIGKPKSQGIKNFALRLLCASTCLPLTALKNFSSHINGIDDYLLPDQFAHLSPNLPALAYHGGNVALSPIKYRDTFGYEISLPKQESLTRSVRSAELEESIYLPPPALAFNGIALLLTKHDLLSEDKLSERYAVISAVKQVVTRYSDGFKAIAKSLLKFSGYFGAKRNEELTEMHQKKVLFAWLRAYVFGDKLEPFIIDAFAGICKNKGSSNSISTQDFAGNLINNIRKLLEKPFNASDEIANGQPEKFIMDSLLLPMLPVISYDNISGNAITYPVGTVEWGFLHAGAGLAMSMGLDLKPVPINEILSLGIILEALLKEGLADPYLIKFFMIPAMLYHVRNTLSDEKKVDYDDILDANGVKRQLVESYFHACHKFHSSNDPLRCLYERIESYQSWSELNNALEMTRQNIKIEPNVSRFTHYQYRFPNLTTAHTIDDLEDRDKLMGESFLIFEQQNTNIADAFAIVDKMVIYDAFLGMAKNEVSFLSASTVTEAWLTFEPQKPLKNVPGKVPYQAGDFAVREKVDTFSAIKDSEERVYALIKERGNIKFLESHNILPLMLIILNISCQNLTWIVLR
ncbi:hypothetical protein ABK905_05070 [Acerihabitans sp. KWT182]|uniref:Uncharacterized protein n=1 Tax=Acerihabitans sp. KWT182 TaxID=3157919 RepID=A0AAU7QBR9_9GAMM